MIFRKTKIEGLYIIEPEIKNDERGYFARIFAREELEREGLSFDIVHRDLHEDNIMLKEGVDVFKNIQLSQNSIKQSKCNNKMVYKENVFSKMENISKQTSILPGKPKPKRSFGKDITNIISNTNQSN